MKRTFCFGCGAEIGAEPGDLAPLCPRCRAKSQKQGGEQSWIVRHRGQRPQGPQKREVVEEWILRGLVDATDEVSGADEAWQTFNVHAEFRDWFTPGHELNKRRLGALKTRRRGRSARAWAARLRVLAALAAVAAVGVLVWFAIQTGATVIPEPWVNAFTTRWKDLTSRFLDTMEVATTNPAEKLAVRVPEVLPGEEVIQALAATVPAGSEPARLHLMRGRDRLMKEIALAPEGAIRELEAAAVAAPRDAVTLAALAEIYGLAGRYQPTKADQALVLLSRADTVAPGLPDVLRARTVIALGAGSFESAKRVADECLAIDAGNPHCLYYQGIALLGLERWAEAEAALSKVHSAAPHVPRFRLALCEAATLSGSYRSAREMTDAFVDEYPHVAEGYALSARLAWATADFPRALREAQKAVRLEPSDLESRLLAAELLLSSGDAAGAGTLLDPLLADEATRSHALGGRVYLVASFAHEGTGELPRALELARAAQDLRPNWAPTSFGLGTALALSGNLQEAENVFKAASTEDLAPVEAGRYWVRLGQLYYDQGRAKAAMTAFERAVEAYPSSEEARLGLVAVYLDLSNLSKAVDMLRSIGPTDFEQDDTHPPNSICPLAPLALNALDVRLAKAIADDIRFTRQRESAKGILAYHEGRYADAEALLEKALTEDDTDAVARGYLARIAMRKGAWQEAEHILARLLATPGNEGIFSAMLGICRARGGQGEAALAEMERTSLLVAELPAVHRMYAEALFRAGHREKALAEARTAWTIDPLDHAARRLVLTEADGTR